MSAEPSKPVDGGGSGDGGNSSSGGRGSTVQRGSIGRLPLALAAAALIAAVLLVYFRAGSYGFLDIDDPQVVYQNDYVRGGVTARGLEWAFATNSNGNWRPVTWISHMVDCSLFGLDARGHHWTNIALHALNALLLLLVLARATGYLWRSLAVAAIFALHPQRVESVAWVSERGDLLGGMFSLLALLGWVWWTDGQGSRKRYWAAFAAFVLGLMSKPGVFALPLLLLVIDYWPLRRFEQTPARKLWREKLPFFAAGAACLGLAIAGSVASGMVPSLQAIPFRYRTGSGVMATLAFLEKYLWPRAIAFSYNDIQPETAGLVLAGFVLSMATMAALRSRLCCPYLAAGWAWFGVMVTPVLVFAQMGRHLFADRLTYLLLIGPTVALVWLAAEWCKDKPWARMGSAVLAMVPVLALAGLSWQQVSYWENKVTLYRHTLTVTERNHRIMAAYGDMLASERLLTEAEPVYRQAAAWKPDSAEYHLALAQTLSRMRREDEAIVEYRTAIRLDPNNASARVRFTALLIHAGSYEEAAGHLRLAIRAMPEDPEAQRLRNLLLLMAPHLKVKPLPEESAQAKPTIEDALELRPLNSDQALELGFVLAVLLAAMLWPGWGSRLFQRLLEAAGRLAREPGKAMLYVALLPVAARLLLLPLYPVPEPLVADEFGHLLLADTLASGRVANPPHPMREHFESIYVIQEPSYASIYPFAQGMVLSAAKLTRVTPWLAVLASVGVMCASLYWMLAGWLPPRWALLGAVLAALRFSILSHWMNSYWGGSVPAIGGALLLGALPRIYRGEGSRYGYLFGLGLAILAQSRPYEGFLVAAPASAALAIWLLRARGAEFGARLKQAVVPVLAVVVAVGAFSAYYNFRVTGSATTLPYFHYKASYGVPQSFYWQKPVPPGKSVLLPELKENYEWQLSAYETKSSLRTLAKMTLLKMQAVWMFYMQPAWTLPLLAIPWAFRNRRIRFLLLASACVIAGVALYPLMYPHYLAPVCGVFLAMLIQCLRYMRLWKWRGQRVGAALVHAIVLFSVSGILLSPAGADMMAANLVHTRTARARILKELENRAGHHLVIVRYSPNHNFHVGVVYNEANIDQSPVIWARDLGDEKNQLLIRHYAKRNAWLFDADVQPVQLVPYPNQQGPGEVPQEDGAPGALGRPGLPGTEPLDKGNRGVPGSAKEN